MQELLSNLWSLEKGHPVMEPVEVVGEFGGLKVGNHPKKWLYDCLPLVPFSNTLVPSYICIYFPQTVNGLQLRWTVHLLLQWRRLGLYDAFSLR